MRIFKLIKYYSTFLPYIFKILYFNLHYLPFKDAVKLPILLRKPHLDCMKGQILIEGKIKMGMIRLGNRSGLTYPDSGIIWNNEGGTVVFKGGVVISNSSAMHIGECGLLELGKEIFINAAFKLDCMHHVVIGEFSHISANCIIMDSNFHELTDLRTGMHKCSYAPIIVGKNDWIGFNCTLMKGVVIPDFCTISACSVLQDKIVCKPYSVLGGNPIRVYSEGHYYFNLKDCDVHYPRMIYENGK